MPSFFPVFAGLGSGSLFSEENLRRAEENALSPECAILLQSCHRTFLEQISDAIDCQILSIESIDLNDFVEPKALIRPGPEYSQNVILQHTTLFLQQVMAYMVYQKELGGLVGATGFCTGLLPAAAVATSGSSIITLISRSHEFFQVALWVGIRSEKYRIDHLTNLVTDPRSSALPCSYVIDGISEDTVTDLLHEASLGHGAFISASLASTRVTLSGIPSIISTFISESVPSHCRTQPVAVYSLYHHDSLQVVRDQVLGDLGRQKQLLQTKLSISAPIISTESGDPISLAAEPTLEEVATAILDMIFVKRVDWVAVQRSVASQITQCTFERPINIVNYGPGMGISPTVFQDAPGNEVAIIDAAKEKISPSEPCSSRLTWDDIAIVGMAIDLPGASDANALWEGLVAGAQACSEIPSTRFSLSDYGSQNTSKGARILNTRYGNFLENPFLFDAEHFGISRREAKSMDPQQRILLQTAYRALEDAGYVPDTTPSFARDTFGCWIGNATLDYVDNLRNDIDVYYSTGTLRAFLSARISYVFGWSGPSITLDTACSSSIVALHQAARSILAGDCRTALVGAANTITSPDMYLGLDRAHFLSPSGQCKAFDASADGYCRAEGCGIFVIKRLSDALKEGDRIHAVIKAIEINQSGNTHSITHPHVPTQEALFEKMFRKSKINPHDISVVEMHGTGTQAGDPNEVESVRRALCNGRSLQNPVHLTSIKANIGHSEAVSGIAGLAKLILMMKNGYIPPQVSLKTLNPRIQPLGVDGAMIDTVGVEWPRTTPNKARIGMLNNFGAGGSNAAVIISENLSPSESEPQPVCSATTFVCGISAKSERAIAKLKDTLGGYLTNTMVKRKPPSLADVCATLTSRRQIYDHRVAVTATSLEELAEKLRYAVFHDVSKTLCATPQAVFLFSGQGSQYLGMGRELMERYRDFADCVNMCDDWLVKNNYPSCLSIIQAEGGDIRGDTADKTMWQAFQSAIFVLEAALAKLLVSWGIQPQAVVGHSLGEYAALVTAGVIGLFDGLKLVAHRAKLMMERCELGQTSMLAVNCSAAKTLYLIDARADLSGLVISCNNSETDCVVGGRVPQLLLLKQYLTDTLSVRSKLLDVPLAFHTAAMDPILEDFTAFAVRDVRVFPPKMPVVSNLLGRTVSVGEQAFSPEYFAKQCRAAVAFDDGISHFLSHSTVSKDCWRWIELGPHPSIQPMLRGRLSSASISQTLLPTLMKNVPPCSTMARILSHFYETSSGVDWRKIFSQDTRYTYKLVDLPGMPFFPSEFHVPYREVVKDVAVERVAGAAPNVVANSFAVQVIERFSPSVAKSRAIYDTPVVLLKDFIEGHLVCGYALCPASVYHEMVLAALKDSQFENGSSLVWSLSKVTYSAPMVYGGDSDQVLRVIIMPTTTPDRFDFTVMSYVTGLDPSVRGTVHCSGIVKQGNMGYMELKYSRLQASMRGTIDSLKQISRANVGASERSPLQVFSRRAMYDKIFTRVVEYSEPFQKVESILINDDTGEALASCSFPEPYLTRHSTIPASSAIFMDVLLHVAGFAANLKLPNDVMGICKEVGSATTLRAPVLQAAAHQGFEVYCSTFDTQDSDGRSFTIANAYATDSNGLVAVFKGMVFQHVKMGRIEQALRMATRSSTHAIAQTPSTTQTGQKRKDTNHNLVQPVDSTPAMKIGDSMSPPGRIAFRDLVANVCGLGTGELTSDTRLEMLGVDSLMIIELGSELSSALGLELSIDALGVCVTVGDIERLCEALSPSSSGSDVDADSPVTGSVSGGSSTGNSTPASASTTSGAVDMVKIIADLCGAREGTVAADSELRALGIDSLMFLELAQLLKDLYGGINLSSDELSECHNISDIEKLVENLFVISDRRSADRVEISPELSNTPNIGSETAILPVHQQSAPPAIQAMLASEEAVFPAISKLLQLSHQPEEIQAGPTQQASVSNSPLFLIHDGSGICTHYRRLRSLGRRVLALHDPKFLARSVEQRVWGSLTAMASSYADTISSMINWTAGEDCILGGWSFGGVVAFEAARILMAHGRPVRGVVLIDSPPPMGHLPLSDAIIDAVTTQSGESGAVTGVDRGQSTTASVLRKLVKRSFRICADLLGDFGGSVELRQQTYNKMAAPVPHAILLRSAVGWAPPQGYDGVAVGEMENPWLQDRRDASLATAGWEMLTGRPLQYLDIPGNHFQVFDAPNVAAVSAAMVSACSNLESKLPKLA